MLTQQGLSGGVDALPAARAELARRLRAGQDCHAEELATSFGDLAEHPECVRELVLAELAIRRELGQALEPASWLERFPQWRSQLEQWFHKPASESAQLDSATVELGTPRPAEDRRTAGTRFRQYELGAELGRGGMGIVYRARDTELDRVVALKRIRGGIFAAPEDVQRFQREARATAQLCHPHIVPLYEVGEHDGDHYLTMGLAANGCLARQKKRFAEPRAAAGLVEKIARAVHHAHQKGILHRDLKPGNILLDENDEPRVSDFGLAKFLDGDAELTRTGIAVGTPAYMAPEQAAGDDKAIGPASEVWSLGVILYELITGERPFPGKSRQEVSQRIWRHEPAAPRALRPGLHRDLETIILKCLERHPARRYATAEALADDLQCWLEGRPISNRPPGAMVRSWRWARRHPLVCASAVVVALAATAAAMFQNLSDPDRLVRSYQGQLAAGQPVTLVGPTGPPRWSRWTMPAAVAGASTDPQKPLSLTTQELNCLELLPTTQCRAYKFSAEVRHEQGHFMGYAGLYVRRREYPSARGADHLQVEFRFNDQQIVSTPPGPDPVLCQLRRFRAGGPADRIDLTSGTGAYKVFQPVGPVPGQERWRKLALEVRPEAIHAFWEGENIGEIRRGELNQYAFELLRRPGYVAEGIGDEPFGEGIGLLIMRATASFRSVVIEPLPVP